MNNLWAVKRGSVGGEGDADTGLGELPQRPPCGSYGSLRLIVSGKPRRPADNVAQREIKQLEILAVGQRQLVGEREHHLAVAERRDPHARVCR